MKKILTVLFNIIFIFLLILSSIDGVSAEDKLEYECKYNNDSITIKRIYHDNVPINSTIQSTVGDYYSWEVIYPNGTTGTFINLITKGNVFPSNNCEDIFYSAKAEKIFAVDKNSFYYINTMNQYCSTYDDLQHFCDGGCKIDNVPCGDENNQYETEWGTCPPEILPVIKFLKIVVINTLQIFVPIILILMGTIDFAKAVFASDEKAIKDATNKFIKRAIAAIITFFITTVVVIVMDALASADVSGFEDWKACWFYDKD